MRSENGDIHAGLGRILSKRDFLELAFGRNLALFSSYIESNLTDQDLPEWFDPQVTTDRVSRAVSWVLQLDATAEERLEKGLVVRVRIPVAAPPPIPSLAKRSGESDSWRLRLPAGTLVRPIFLKQHPGDCLFPFQKEGIAWLLKSKAAVLADEMGLGKTVQAIYALRSLFNSGEARSALVLCPKSLLANWEEELTRWAPELSRARVLSKANERGPVWANLLGRLHVAITNYDEVREVPAALSQRGVDVVVADEAHRVRNLSAGITLAVRQIRRGRFWALTGTPIERDATDFATLLSTVAPQRFAPSDARSDSSALRCRARPYVLRRLREDVLSQLPPVLESKETLELLPPQKRSYRQVVAEMLGKPFQPAAMLQLLNRLRTICDFDPTTKKSAKVNRIVEILEDIATSGEKAVVFSYLLEPLYILKNLLVASGPSRPCRLLEGKMRTEERDDVLVSFKQSEGFAVLLASSRVGGEGLTMTEANHVVFLNEWWNPSANSQARDRVVRIGQTRVVRVYRFMCRKTVEESLNRILIEKGETYADILDGLSRSGEISPRARDLLAYLEQNLLSSEDN
jgi:SNF2 family DNA or RNA helicase